MSLDEQITALETNLNALIRDGAVGVKDLMFGDISRGAMRYPAVHFLLQSAEQNDMQVIRPNQIGWDLTYQVSCIFAGVDSQNTLQSTRSFTNSVYNLIQGQRKAGDLLTNTIFDMDCLKIDYVTFEQADKSYVYGGIITLIIQIFEDRS